MSTCNFFKCTELTKKMNRYLKRNALFCVITQRVVVISHLRFGTTYRSHLQESLPPTATVLLVSSIYVTSFGRADRPQAFTNT